MAIEPCVVGIASTLAVMIVAIGFLPWRDFRVFAVFGAIFLFGCTLQVGVGILLLTRAKTRITVSPEKITYFFGIGSRGLYTAIPRTPPISVTMAHRGTRRWFRKVDDIVVRNAEGQEIYFGGFLDKPRQDFLAAKLARELTAGDAEKPAANSISRPS